jgi:hypothetical protein
MFIGLDANYDEAIENSPIFENGLLALSFFGLWQVRA